MLKTLRNGKKAVLQQDLQSINGQVVEAGTIVEMVNLLHVTAIIKLDLVHCEHTEFPLYQVLVVKSEAMFTPIASL